MDELLEMRVKIERDVVFYSRIADNYSHYSIKAIINNLKLLLDNINSKINMICEHEWQYDYIDIDPDRSIRIRYCLVCQCTC